MSRILVRTFIATVVLVAAVFAVSAQGVSETPTTFRIGEKVSFNISFEQFGNVAFLELQTVSRGRFANRDAVEIQARAKTFEIVSAAFAQIDERRTVYAAADSGLPLYIDRMAASGGIPKQKIVNNLDVATPVLDMATMIYRVRANGANGSFTFAEDGENYVMTFASGASEVVKTDLGEFDTVITTVQSSFFDSYGIKDLRVNFTSDERKLPVSIRFSTAKGEFVGKLAGLIEPVKPTPSPTPTPTPRPTATPIPTPVPPKYVDDQPLLPELAFSLGEKLEYRVNFGGQKVADVVLEAKQRRLVQNVDTLTLTANVVGIAPPFRQLSMTDSATALVNPDTLAPYKFDMRLTGGLSNVSQNLTFDPRTGGINFGASRADAPVGTHSLLSLLYAMRSFNLRPSKIATNPVNDTRVAVFWGDKPYIFVLRPSNPDNITIGGERLMAQMISITTGNPQLDSAQIKVWLSLDDKRTPLRIMIGGYTADLVIRDATLFR
ncbi:MAG: DUF3108 domain-containing protein [Blastocatellia bacterium]|nr:DUF3108 domain-containing protein [Blastocatellia bacterium]